MTSEIIRISENQLARVRRLIQKRCCNYDNGSCLLLDFPECSICPQWVACSLICVWFRDAVLPTDKRLEADLFQSHPAGYCKHCGKPLFHRKPNQKYCDRCAVLVRKEKEAARQRRRYRNLRISG